MQTRTWCWLALAILVIAAGSAQAARDADGLEEKAEKKAGKDRPPKDTAQEPVAAPPSEPVPAEPVDSPPVAADPGAVDPSFPHNSPVASEPAESSPPSESQVSAAEPTDARGDFAPDEPPFGPHFDATLRFFEFTTVAPSVHDTFLAPDQARTPVLLAVAEPASDVQSAPTIIVRTPGWVGPVLGIFALGAVVSSTALARLAFRPSPVLDLPVPRPVAVPTTAADSLRRGRVCVGEGRHEEASEHFARAARIEPELGVAHFCLGLCLTELGRHADALGAFQDACALDASDVIVRIHLARACVRAGQHHAAMDALAPIVRSDVDVAQAARVDPAFAPLLDHPRFLMLTGAL